jgi:hypothetical protein
LSFALPVRLATLARARPPQSLHTLLIRLCAQICDPPHALQRVRRRPCQQIELPPHSMQSDLRRPWMHIEPPGQHAPWSVQDIKIPQKRCKRWRATRNDGVQPAPSMDAY